VRIDELAPEDKRHEEKPCESRGERDDRTLSVESFLPRLHDRTRNVYLIDGGRGSGKTTVLITLLDELVSWYRKGKPERLDALPKELVERGLPRNVIPLGLVDLETFSDDRSVLYQVVASFRRVVDFLDSRDGGDACRGSGLREPFASSQSELRKAWNDLVKVLALGWTRGGQKRRETLRPADFVAEFEDSERCLGDTSRSFDKFMKVLCETFSRRTDLSVRPLFVVPLDDVDMQPDRTRDIVRTLRFFQHPSLLFVVTADIELLLAALRRDCFEELGLDVKDVKAAAQEDVELAMRLARQILEKVFPRAQRLELGEVPLEKRTELVCLSTEEIDALGAQLLVREHILPRALPSTIRGLIDLEALLMQVRKREPHATRGAPRIAERIWTAALEDADVAVSRPERERLEHAVSVDDRTGSLRVSERFPQAGPVAGDRRIVERDGAFWRIGASQTIGFGSSLAPGGDGPRGRREYQTVTPWPGRLSAAGVMAVVASGVGGDPDRARNLTWELNSRLVLVEHGERVDGISGWIAWPCPSYSRLGLHIDLEARWSAHEALFAALQPRDLAWLFLRLILDVGLGVEWKSVPYVPGHELASLKDDLRKLVGGRGVDPAEEVRAHRAWFTEGFPLLAAPESGLPPEFANDIFGLSRELMPHDEERIRQARESRWRLTASSTDWERDYVAQPIHALDSRSAGAYEFSRRIGKVDSELAPDAERLIELKSAFAAWHVADRGKVWRGANARLSMYLTDRRREALGADAGALSRILNTVKPLSPVAGESGRLIALVWQACSDEQERVRFVSGRLESPVSLGETVPPDPKVMFLLPGGQSVTFSAFGRRHTAGKTSWTRAQQVVFDLAMDLDADARELDPVDPDPVDDPVWADPAVSVMTLGQCFSPPVPNWSAPLDNEWFRTCSDNAVVALSSLAIPDTSNRADNQELVDTYYRWLIQFVWRWCGSERFPEVELSSRDTAYPPSVVVAQCHATVSPTGVPTRWWARWRAWLRFMPVFAAPELGASPRFAEELLDAFDKAGVTVDEMRTVREEFVERQHRSRGTPLTPADKKKLLDDLDADQPNHPWVKRVSRASTPA
jgi:hypothetical protein